MLIHSLEILTNITNTIQMPDFSHWIILAQNTNIKDPDILGQIQKAFKTFIDSGQVYALLIGLFLGYYFRSFTS